MSAQPVGGYQSGGCGVHICIYKTVVKFILNLPHTKSEACLVSYPSIISHGIVFFEEGSLKAFPNRYVDLVQADL